MNFPYINGIIESKTFDLLGKIIQPTVAYHRERMRWQRRSGCAAAQMAFRPDENRP